MLIAGLRRRSERGRFLTVAAPILNPKTVELMAAVHLPDTLPGRPKGRGFGLSVQVVSDAVTANLRVSDGSYGWDGAFGTDFWIDLKEKIVGILMV